MKHNEYGEFEFSLVKSILDSTTDAIYAKDTMGRYLMFNAAAEKITGKRAEEVLHKDDRFLFGEAEANAIMAGDRLVMEGQVPLTYEEKATDASGEVRTFLSTKGPLFDGDGHLIGLFGIARDITNISQLKSLFNESEERLSKFYNNAPLSMQSLDETGHVLDVNETWLSLLGYSKEEVVGQWFGKFVDPKFVSALKDRLALFKEQGYLHSEYELLRKDKTPLTVSVEGRISHKEDGSFEKTFCILQDITERKKNLESIKYLSFHDQLTGLYNRRFYEEELKRLDTRRNLPMTILIGDVNGLKLINDSFGHATGDELLILVANAIKSSCRTDDIVARLGGDEFIVILPKIKSSEAQGIINRIQAALSKEKVASLTISVSFGVSTKDHVDQLISQTIKDAEDNMYKSKLHESASLRSKTIKIIMDTLFEKNKREMLHSSRVSEICEALAEKMKLDKSVVNQIKITGLLHDIGKIGIDEKILNSDQKLDPEEWVMIRKHPEIGYRILSSSPEFFDISVDVLQHHERWDGKGYPNGLVGDQISLAARIIAVADTYDAMMSDRAYRKAFTQKSAVEEISRCSGTQFDPMVVSAFLSLIKDESQEPLSSYE